jgi:hypothetical protein
MPRASRLGPCVKCGMPADVGAFLSFYVLKGDRRIPARQQERGSLTTRPFCARCFLKLANQHGGLTSEAKDALRKLVKPKAML